MGRSQAHPTLSRRDNKKRKENQRFFRVKKHRTEVLGKKKQTEHNLQQTVVGHNRSILKAKVPRTLTRSNRVSGLFSC
ncbi:hypothetical protein DIPPA_08081 [Diplonema papillatum]|nr:hypothetical protein DIPPA_08081 [Diplonema papillatum]